MSSNLAKTSKYTGENPNGFLKSEDVLKQYVVNVDNDITKLFLAVQRLQNLGFNFAARTAVADTAYSALSTDVIIAYSTLTAGRQITLLAASAVSGQIFIIKDEAGAAATYTITIATVSGNIDGAATKTITSNYGVVRVYSNGTNYFTF